MTLHQFNPCTNSLCDRVTTAVYCCWPCQRAKEGGYKIHEDGPLGHTETCDQRHRERGPSTVRQRIRHRAARGVRPPPA